MPAAEPQRTLRVQFYDPREWHGPHLEAYARAAERLNLPKEKRKPSLPRRAPLVDRCIADPAFLAEDDDGIAALTQRFLLRLRSSDDCAVVNILAREVWPEPVDQNKKDFEWRVRLCLFLSYAAVLKKKRETATTSEAGALAKDIEKELGPSALRKPYAQETCNGVLNIHAIINDLIVNANLTPVQATLLLIMCKSPSVHDDDCTAKGTSDGPHRSCQYQKVTLPIREWFYRALSVRTLPLNYNDERNKICFAGLLAQLDDSLRSVRMRLF